MNCQFPFDNRCYEIKQQKILDIRSNNAGCLHHYLCLIFVVLRIGLNVLFFDWLWLAFIIALSELLVLVFHGHQHSNARF